MRHHPMARPGGRPAALVGLLALLAASTCLLAPVAAQGVDCARLQQQISASGGGGRLAAAAARQRSELARAEAAAHQFGCDRQQFLFFGGPSAPQCGGLNARIAQMQANLGQIQAGGGRDDLQARFNAYCRGGQAQQSRPRGFFESIFGGGEEPRQAPPADVAPDPASQQDADGDDREAHAGSQAVCVRTCDGGFFPMNTSVRHNQDSLNELCTALCPGTQVAVFSRNPNSEIKTAVSLDGTPYMDLPNALKFQKSFDAACTCRPPGKSWVEALAGAENALGSQRKGDILVTPEKSAELSRPTLDAKARSQLLKNSTVAASAPTVPPPAATGAAGSKPAAGEATEEAAGSDGATRRVRKVGPQL